MDTLVSQADFIVHFAAETHVTRSIYDNLTFFDVLGTQVVANAGQVPEDIKTIARTLFEQTGRSESLVQYVDDRPGQVFRHTDISKAKRVLGFSRCRSISP